MCKISSDGRRYQNTHFVKLLCVMIVLAYTLHYMFMSDSSETLEKTVGPSQVLLPNTTNLPNPEP